MGQMRLIDSSEFVDRVLGKVGTPERDAIDLQIKEEKEIDMKLYSFDSVLDRHIGPRGSEAREDFEREVMEAVESSKMAERLKAARTEQNLTQEQLGKKAGVDRSQVSRLERGKSATLSSIKRISQALGVMLW